MKTEKKHLEMATPKSKLNRYLMEDKTIGKAMTSLGELSEQQHERMGIRPKI